MTDTDLASLLRPYRIRSDTVRGEDAMGNPERGKGYYLRSFKDAFSRYLPLSVLLGRDTVTNPENAGENEVLEDVTKLDLSRVGNPGNANKSAVCHDVTTQKGGNRGAAGYGGVDDATPTLRDGLL